MWILTCFLVLALGASAAPLQSCGPQNIVLKTVTDTWSLPTTKMSPMSTCTYSFQIPSETFAEIILSASGLGNQDTVYAAGILTPFKGPNDSYQLNTLFPTKFDVTFSAGENSTMTAQFSVNLQKVNTAVANSIRTNSNDESKLIYPDEWQVGTSYEVAADTLLRIYTAFNGVNTATLYQLNNVFIYDGERTTTLLGASGSFLLSNNKKVSLYLARKITDLQGVVFLTDNSNLDGFINHHVQYIPTDPSYPTSYASMNADWQNKPNSPWGAVTIVGKSDGSTPIDVRDINNLSGSGSFLYVHGGPLPNHTTGIPFGKKNLPLHAAGVMTTFYLTQGDGTFRYTIN